MSQTIETAQKIELDVAFIFDVQYRMPTLVAISSLIRHRAPSTHYRIFCVTAEDVSEWEQFECLVAEVPEVSITRVDPGQRLQELASLRRRTGTVAHVPSVALAKMLLPSILPSAEEGRRLLYLDCDMIVAEDLASLATRDLDGRPVAAARDNGALFKKASHVAWNPDYFNSGLLLMDPALWRSANKLDDLREAVRRDDVHRYLDQDALNTAFRGQVHLLEPRWNLIVPTIDAVSSKSIEPFNERYDTTYSSADELADDAAVLHYAGTKFKPWRNPERFMADRWWAEFDAMTSVVHGGRRNPVGEG